MSSILKALKKVETDNASRRPDELRIDAEILRTENHTQFSSSGILLVSLLLVALGVGTTYLYMKRDKTGELSVLNSSVISGQKQQSLSATPDIRTEQLPPAIVVVPAEQQNIFEGTRVQKQLPSSQGTTAPVVANRPVMTERPVLSPQRANSMSAPPNNSIVPAIRVNGIAFQDDGSEAVAMVNGEPHSRGGIIAGVKVEEIYKNRVKFSYSGEVFEVLMGQSNR